MKTRGMKHVDVTEQAGAFFAGGQILACQRPPEKARRGVNIFCRTARSLYRPAVGSGPRDGALVTMADFWSPSSEDPVLFFPDARTRTPIICCRHFLLHRLDQIWQHRRRFLASYCVEKHSIVAVSFETKNLS